MGTVSDCDNCGKILSVQTRVQLIFPSVLINPEQQHAGYSLELCDECAAPALEVEAVQNAARTFEDKMYAAVETMKQQYEEADAAAAAAE